jgi:Rad3-related DNA helicase
MKMIMIMMTLNFNYDILLIKNDLKRFLLIKINNMNTRQFLSPNLKFNNNLIYYLHFNELNNENYKQDNYFIQLEENKKEGSIIINNNKIYYKVILSLFDENVVIEMKYDIELNNQELLQYFYCIQEYIKDIKDIDNNYIKDYKEKYEDNFLKYINNLVIV